MYNDVGPHAASLLSAARLSGEDHNGHHCASCLQVVLFTFNHKSLFLQTFGQPSQRLTPLSYHVQVTFVKYFHEVM